MITDRKKKKPHCYVKLVVTVTAICSVVKVRIVMSSMYSKIFSRKWSIYHGDNRRKKQTNK